MEICQLMFGTLMVGLGTWSAVEIWHHGSIFESPRNLFSSMIDSPYRGSRFLGKLFTCPFCLSVWTAMMLSGTLLEYYSSGKFLWLLPLLTLCSCRLANLANDVFYSITRTTGDRWEPEASPAEDDNSDIDGWHRVNLDDDDEHDEEQKD